MLALENLNYSSKLSVSTFRIKKQKQNKHIQKSAEKINNKNSKINEVENRKTIEKIHKIKVAFLKKINKISKRLQDLTEKGGDKTQITNTIDLTDTKRRLKNSYKLHTFYGEMYVCRNGSIPQKIQTTTTHPIVRGLDSPITIK